MAYIRTTPKSVEQAVADVEAASTRHGFGVLHTYDFHALLEKKGFPIPNACVGLDICQPKLASEILHRELAVNLALPCRVSVYQEAGQTKIGMIPPTEILGLISDAPELSAAAQNVEKIMTAIIDESV